MEISALKNIITKIKKLNEWAQQHNGRNERNSELKYRSTEINHPEHKRKKVEKKVNKA